MNMLNCTDLAALYAGDISQHALRTDMFLSPYRLSPSFVIFLSIFSFLSMFILTNYRTHV
jgi:hypothetical protein